jgi:magnesium transporter
MAIKMRKSHSIKIGLAPGAIVHVGERRVKKALIDLIDYDLKNYKSKKLKNIKESFPFKETPTITWLNVTGLHEVELIQQIGDFFNIHPLVIEDILNTEQRPKVEIYDDYIFIVLKMLTYDSKNKGVEKEQISLLLGKNYVITFQEKPGDIFDPLRDRIKLGKGHLRKSSSDYLMYAIIDIVIDHYFLVLENINEEIESLENLVVNLPDRRQMERIHFLKRELLEFRRSNWPVREIVTGLLREESPLLKESTEPFLRDLYDHVINVSETIESSRDMVSGLLDIYLSNISNRMNEVMKVLTIIATIFIPLSFLAGVYGMNFDFIPELKWKWGYFGFWTIILIVSGIMLYYFRRKKWL